MSDNKVTEKNMQEITNFFYKSGAIDKALSVMRYYFNGKFSGQ